jgi:hypothetical protein
MLIISDKLIRGILIGLTIYLCSLLLIVTLYLLYRYRKRLIYSNRNNISEDLNNKQEFGFRFPSLIKEEEEKKMKSSNNIGRTSTIIEELMRKSLELAQTAEKVADEKEKKTNLNENISLHIRLPNKF